MTLKITVIVTLCSLMFTPAPVIQPGDPFVFDPALCPSPAMKALVIPVGSTYSGELDVYEPDGEMVTVTASKIAVGATPVTVKDPADILGLAVTHTFSWSWTPTTDDIGLHYVNVAVADPHGAKDSRTIVLLIKVNSPPVITGCR